MESKTEAAHKRIMEHSESATARMFGSYPRATFDREDFSAALAAAIIRWERKEEERAKAANASSYNANDIAESNVRNDYTPPA